MINLNKDKNKKIDYTSLKTPEMKKNLNSKSTFFSISPVKHKKIKKRKFWKEKIKKVTFFEKIKSFENLDLNSKGKKKIVFFGQRKSMTFNFYFSENKSKKNNSELEIQKRNSERKILKNLELTSKINSGLKILKRKKLEINSKITNSELKIQNKNLEINSKKNKLEFISQNNNLEFISKKNKLDLFSKKNNLECISKNHNFELNLKNQKEFISELNFSNSFEEFKITKDFEKLKVKKNSNFKLKVRKNLEKYIHSPKEDNNVETDVEIFENGLIRSFESLERFLVLFKNSENSVD